MFAHDMVHTGWYMLYVNYCFIWYLILYMANKRRINTMGGWDTRRTEGIESGIATVAVAWEFIFWGPADRLIVRVEREITCKDRTLSHPFRKNLEIDVGTRPAARFLGLSGLRSQ